MLFSLRIGIKLKLLFLLFYDNVESKRERMRIIPERLDSLWFLGYGLDDAVPDHSVLSKARARWGKKVFARTVWQCVRAGLVDGDKTHVDCSNRGQRIGQQESDQWHCGVDGGFARGL